MAALLTGCAPEGSAPQPAGVAAQRQALAVAAPQPVALWHLDEDCSSTVVTDASGRGHHGVRSGGAGCTVGRVDQAASFDGVDDRIEVPDAPALHFGQRMTVAAWVYPTRSSGVHAIVNKWYAKDAFGLVQDGDRFAFSVALPGGTWGVTHDVYAPATAGVWTHVAGVYDGTSLALYVNGALISRKVIGLQPQALQDSTRPVVIGNHPSWSPFAGRIDEVRLYDVDLTAAQVKALTRNTYYVATSGNDAHPGTLAKPFRTFRRAGQAAGVGDTVLVRGGTYYTGDDDPATGEPVGPVKLDAFGTAEERIVFQPYPGEKVVLDGSRARELPGKDVNVDLLQVRGAYYDIVGFELANARGVAINLSRWDGTGGTFIRVLGNTIHDAWKGAVYPGPGAERLHFEGNTVFHNVKGNRADLVNCHVGGWPSAVNLTRRGDVVVRNNIYENWGEGIGAYGTGHVVQENELRDNFSVDLYVSNLRDSFVERNLITSTGLAAFQRRVCPVGVSCPERPPGETGTCPWTGDLRVLNASVGLAIANEDPPSVNPVQLGNNRIAHNIILGARRDDARHIAPRRTGLQVSSWKIDDEHSTGPADLGGSIVANNTVVCEAAEEVFSFAGDVPLPAGNTGTVLDNLFYQLNGTERVARVRKDQVEGVKFLSNAWFGGDGSFSWPAPGTSASDVWVDPRLVNPHGSTPADVELTGLSPLIDEGSAYDVGVRDVFDFFGTQRPQGAGFDIGAHELVPAAVSVDR